MFPSNVFVKKMYVKQVYLWHLAIIHGNNAHVGVKGFCQRLSTNENL